MARLSPNFPADQTIFIGSHGKYPPLTDAGPPNAPTDTADSLGVLMATTNSSYRKSATHLPEESAMRQGRPGRRFQARYDRWSRACWWTETRPLLSTAVPSLRPSETWTHAPVQAVPDITGLIGGGVTLTTVWDLLDRHLQGGHAETGLPRTDAVAGENSCRWR